MDPVFAGAGGSIEAGRKCAKVSAYPKGNKRQYHFTEGRFVGEARPSVFKPLRNPYAVKKSKIQNDGYIKRIMIGKQR
ncbi:MAG TPA: hypothetical protein PKH09_09375 [Parvularculaceae bacterium]|nr:hypothetical protein [Parvularculaceae bacterium]